MPGDLRVAVKTGRDADGGRAEAEGAAHGRGGADAEAAGFVRRGHDDAAGLGRPADDDGLAFEVGVVVLLYGGVEGVEVGVNDGAVHEAIITGDWGGRMLN